MNSVGVSATNSDRRATFPGTLGVVIRVTMAMMLATVCALWPAGKPAIAAGTCSCQAPDSATALSDADVAFTGTLSSYTVNPVVKGANEAATYTFRVDGVYKGTAPSTAVVFSFAAEGACGLVGMETGIRYVVFANLVRSDTLHPSGAPDGTMMSTFCNGNVKLDAASTAAVAATLGTVAPPLTAAPGDSLPPVALEVPSTPDTTWKRSLAIVGGSLAGIGLIARILAGRRRAVVR